MDECIYTLIEFVHFEEIVVVTVMHYIFQIPVLNMLHIYSKAFNIAEYLSFFEVIFCLNFLENISFV